MHVHKHWRFTLRHAWSVRFIAVAAACSGLQVGFSLAQPYVTINPIWLAVGAGLAAAGAFVSTIIAQKEFKWLYSENTKSEL